MQMYEGCAEASICSSFFLAGLLGAGAHREEPPLDFALSLRAAQARIYKGQEGNAPC